MEPVEESRATVIEVAEGYYLAKIAELAQQSGIFRRLAAGDNLALVASDLDFNCELLSKLLQYVAMRSNLLDCEVADSGVRFIVNQSQADILCADHVIAQYIGGFGPCFEDLALILRQPSRGYSFLDQARHAEAFSENCVTGDNETIVALVKMLEVTNVFELGCGGGQLLCQLAQNNFQLRAIGIDSNPMMIDLARRNISQVSASDAIQVICGEATSATQYLTADRLDEVEMVIAVSVANAYFYDGRNFAITKFLNYLRSAFPNRMMILSDYFGRLGSPVCTDSHLWQRTLIHDVAQLVSGQGVPPASTEEWMAIYEETSCTLIKSYEAEGSGLAWFIHLIQL